MNHSRPVLGESGAVERRRIRCRVMKCLLFPRIDLHLTRHIAHTWTPFLLFLLVIVLPSGPEQEKTCAHVTGLSVPSSHPPNRLPTNKTQQHPVTVCVDEATVAQSVDAGEKSSPKVVYPLLPRGETWVCR